ncbi:hypothetical protein AB3329_07810 [Streptococcus sp. H31]|uniref:hypothetical protein n=1 Tax=Streptococcus huangxiaojuni TaxID=3237239 RepID=UPI0034A492A9
MKKISLWGVTLLSAAVLVACSTDTNSSTASSGQEQSASAQSQKTYAVGDTIKFDDEAEITITSAEYTEERNEFADEEPEKVLTVKFNVNNLSDEDYIIGNEIELYVGSNKMDTYPLDMTLETISPGRSYENATISFGVNGTGDKELEISPSLSFTSSKEIVKLDLD